jgi:general L-amino acid transport system permease protein
MSVEMIEGRPPPKQFRQSWLRRLFGTPLNALITIATLALLAWVIPPLFKWAILDATWTGTQEDCAARAGACWAFIGAKIRFILFAFFPPEAQWRPTLVIALLVGLLGLSAIPRFWKLPLLGAWLIALVVSVLLMAGTVTPPTVPSNQWGGLPVTLLVWIICFGVAVPLAVLLALARRSRMGGLRTLSVAFIELMRGTPMVAILYVAMLILPMAIPGGQLLDKTLRAMILITLFWSAYVAEVVRAGLQAIPRGQEEAAASLGLGYWRTTWLIVLPQAIRIVIPALVNLAIGFLLATSLLAVIGIFDLLNAAKNSAVDPNWLGFYDEAYVTVAAIYFVFCYVGSRYSQWLERYLSSSDKQRT